jgi:hypothetical protein
MTAAEQRGYFGRTLHVHRTDPGSGYTVEGCVSLCTCCHVVRHGGTVSRRPTLYTPASQGVTKAISVRLDDSTLNDLDVVAAWLSRRSGGRPTRTDAIRFVARRAAHKLAARLRKKLRDFSVNGVD